MGMMTFSKRYSFLDEGDDVGGMLGAIDAYMDRLAPVGFGGVSRRSQGK
jgi:hypothetical protein